MQELLGRWGEGHSYPPMTSRVITGGAAGDLTVTGIRVGDTIAIVQNVAAAGVDLSPEFTVTADDTINNTGGTSTAGMTLLIIWYKAADQVTGA